MSILSIYFAKVPDIRGKLLNTKTTLIAIIAVVIIIGAGAAVMLNHHDENKTDLNGTITIQGSTTVAPYMTAVQEAWLNLHPKVEIQMTANGSGAGASAAINETADLAMLSRDLKDTEKSSGLVQTNIGIDGIMVIVNKAAGIDNVTSEQLEKIFSGQIENWSEIGGNDKEITVVSRESGSGTRDGFEEALKKICVNYSLDKYALENTSTNAVISTVDMTAGAIGYVSIGYTANVKSNSTILALDGVTATEEHVKDGSYPIQRNLVLATKGTPSGLASNLIDWILGADGQKLLLEKGFINIRSTDSSAQTITIQGSTTIAPYMLKVQEIYKGKFNYITLDMTANGSGTGAAAALNGTANLAMLSRNLKDSEIASGLVQTTIGLDGIMAIINTDAGVNSLTSEQLEKIYSGQITNWSEVGGNNKKITVVSRESGSGTRDGFEEALKKIDGNYSLVDNAVETSSTNSVVNTVNKTSGAIGYVSVGHTEKINSKSNITIATLDGVTPTEEHVKDGSYSIQRNLVLATKGTPTGATADLISWILGAEGQELLVKNGFISISE